MASHIECRFNKNSLLPGLLFSVFAGWERYGVENQIKSNVFNKSELKRNIIEFKMYMCCLRLLIRKPEIRIILDRLIRKKVNNKQRNSIFTLSIYN